MRFFCILVSVAIMLLPSVPVGATPFWLVNGGSNGATETSSVGIEAGGTRVLLNRFPLSAELAMNFTFDSIPSDTYFSSNTSNEPYTTKKLNHGPEIGYLVKSGVNLDRMLPNLTLQLGAGYALQTVITVATGTVSGSHWKQGKQETEVYPVGYGGLLYRLNTVCLSVGYNNRRGIVAGIGTTW